jgi:hypothetical protein
MKTHAVTGLRSSRQHVEALESLEERIRARAYELYELRGRDNGRDLEDWLQAEWEEREKTPLRMAIVSRS